MEDEVIKSNISTNLIKYRKLSGLTQYDLALKLNYSDKAVSKWERGEALPDILILHKIATLFGITVNDLLASPEESKKPVATQKKKINTLVITLLAIGLVWLVSTSIFVFFNMFNLFKDKIWLAYIYAIPISMIVAIVFTKIFKQRIVMYLSISALIWTVLLSIHLTIDAWILFIIGIPLQVLTILWFFRKKKVKN